MRQLKKTLRSILKLILILFLTGSLYGQGIIDAVLGTLFVNENGHPFCLSERSGNLSGELVAPLKTERE